MKYTILQIIGFALMVLGIQGAIVLLANDNPGLLSWLNADDSLLIGIYMIISISGVSLLSWAQKKTKKSKK